MSEFVERMSLGTVATLLVFLQLLSVYFLWTLNPISQAHEVHLALFLAADLISFSMVSYIYRGSKRDDGINGRLLIAGCFTVLLLMFVVVAV